METVRKPLNEDRVALLLGSVIFILALLKFSGIDMLGWAVKIGMWVGDPLDAWRPATKGLLPGYGALFATYAILTGALACCVKLMGNDVVKFVKSFTIIFFIAMICYTLGANAYIAANPTQLKAQGIPTMVYYPKPMHTQQAFDGLKQYVPCPVTEELCATVLSLPMHPYLTRETVQTVTDALRRALK